jgi:tyrosine decarboxylase / aspartate 1-decarboxylase
MADLSYLEILKKSIEVLENGFAEMPRFSTDTDLKSIEEALMLTANKLQNNYPYQHPLYAGQMLKPPHLAAQLAYMLAMYINPNNHALDGGKASSEMEKEAVAKMAGMFGWAAHLGHFTSGGTVANLEALWISGSLAPQKWIVASEMAHYTHERISGVLKLPFKKVKALPDGTMDLADLEQILKTGNVGTVIATIGTTGMGTVDPLPEIIDLQAKYGFRIHADAAYGGYFSLASALNEDTAKKFKSLQYVDSLVIDPHKHGLQPYGCGCILFRDPSVGRFYKHDSPYTYFSSNDLHLGEISLECSRPGAAAVAVWTTLNLFPLTKNGIFSQNLDKCINSAQWLYAKLCESDKYQVINKPELDIVIWLPKEKSTTEISEKSRQMFEKAEKSNLYLALFNYPSKYLKKDIDIIDSEYVTCLRSCLMKPEHWDWKEEIWKTIDSLSK